MQLATDTACQFQTMHRMPRSQAGLSVKRLVREYVPETIFVVAIDSILQRIRFDSRVNKNIQFINFRYSVIILENLFILISRAIRMQNEL